MVNDLRAAAPSVNSQSEEQVMRTLHAIAIGVVVLLGIGVKLYFFPGRAADARIPVAASASMDIMQMDLDHPNMKNLRPQDITDLY
jgi:hypothetical protein